MEKTDNSGPCIYNATSSTKIFHNKILWMMNIRAGQRWQSTFFNDKMGMHMRILWSCKQGLWAQIEIKLFILHIHGKGDCRKGAIIETGLDQWNSFVIFVPFQSSSNTIPVFMWSSVAFWRWCHTLLVQESDLPLLGWNACPAKKLKKKINFKHIYHRQK